MVYLGVVAHRKGLALKPVRASFPSLCHASPRGFVLGTAREFCRVFALSGTFQKFLGGLIGLFSRP
jgi:hypothetical protein